MRGILLLFGLLLLILAPMQEALAQDSKATVHITFSVMPVNRTPVASALHYVGDTGSFSSEHRETTEARRGALKVTYGFDRSAETRPVNAAGEGFGSVFSSVSVSGANADRTNGSLALMSSPRKIRMPIVITITD